ncbi:C2 domain [Trypanosoma vivax]|uniref:C2 domain-containing protein n=1 Tax=Trypanosoma vivax (strain Y486) TaxID=1055687 RepID=G0TZW8_TRYVY|nr:hypothetical protein TRVL_10308 [Trypanosoma vivax]KAH8610823.1 C2 domain [Trypanosoma vivax]CCC50146.1 conserved hypothetical protein [Trypanosoma vivax Y486]
MGRLEVCICGARNLQADHINALPDPYCSVHVGDKTFKTTVARNSCNPVWNQISRFHVSGEANANICIEIWDKNVAADDILGSCCFSLSGLTMGVVEDLWLRLSHCSTKAELHICVLACDFGKKPTDEERWRVTSDISSCPVLATGIKFPPSPQPVTVSTNSNNTPLVSNMGPAVVPAAAQ